MSNDDKPLTKTEAKAFVRRAREALSALDKAISSGDGQAVYDECNEALGSISEVQYAVDASFGGPGIKGVESV